nr:hypothetical protein BaRGS_029085 [Batillaria attramentaria]
MAAVTDSALDTVSIRLYWSKTQPDKPAFIFHNPATATNKRLVFTRADNFTLASRYAAILRREGIRQGDVVCNTLPNSPERLLTDLEPWLLKDAPICRQRALDTVNKRLLHWSKTQPDKPAFIFHNPATATNKRLVFTRADIFTLASRYAAILRREGIRQGDVVCNTLPNSPERLLTDLGIMLAGAVAMNGMVVLSDGADFVGSIQRGGCVAVIVDPKQNWNQPLTVLESRFRSRVGHTVDCPDAPLLKTLLFVDSGKLEISFASEP